MKTTKVIPTPRSRRSTAPAKTNGVTHPRAEAASAIPTTPSKKVATKKPSKTKKEAFGRDNMDCHAATADARAWLGDFKSIPKANAAPILWISAPKLWDIAETLGRELNLKEVQFLVQPDGKVETCSMLGHEFQPVKYLVISHVLLGLVKQYEGLLQIPQDKLLWGGGFMLTKENNLMPLSGSRYRNPAGDFAMQDSVMVQAWIASGETVKDRTWPYCRFGAEKVQKRVADARGRRVELAQMRDVLQKAMLTPHKKGHTDHHRDGDKRNKPERGTRKK